MVDLLKQQLNGVETVGVKRVAVTGSITFGPDPDASSYGYGFTVGAGSGGVYPVYFDDTYQRVESAVFSFVENDPNSPAAMTIDPSSYKPESGDNYINFNTFLAGAAPWMQTNLGSGYTVSFTIVFATSV